MLGRSDGVCVSGANAFASNHSHQIRSTAKVLRFFIDPKLVDME
jgi:hypothetical protein